MYYLIPAVDSSNLGMAGEDARYLMDGIIDGSP
jgi:hypothetical protein